MESNKILKESYDYLGNILRNNTTNKITIDYDKLDEKSKIKLKDALSSSIRVRRKELSSILTGVDCYMNK